MRLRRRFVLRLVALVLAFLFSVPLMLYYLDDSQKKGFQNGLVKLHQRIEQYGMKNLRHWRLEGENNTKVDQKVLLENSIKKYGPESVYTEGRLGNYEPSQRETLNRPGENGAPVFTSMEEKYLADVSVRDYGFNLVASDKIAMDRKIPDTRMEECKFWQYPKESKLPTASVIIVFHNEGFSTLMRTVHSVINMSPPSLLKEVVMVDDKSDKAHLKKHLDDYIKDNFKDTVRLFRNSEREGLIRTRTRGAQYAVGDVIVFLDAHCECNQNWLVPLLARIAYDRTIMAVPIIESIHWENFSYRPVYSDSHYRGIFEWGFLYKESQVPSRELKRRKHNSEPYRAPTHAGGLFAMSRDYFFELGGYDPGLQIWGGENFELSFKIWQCGGSIEWVPCSHVGHVYRNHMPYGFGKVNTKIPVVQLNYMRVVEVWLDDEYKRYFYTREPAIEGYPIGNITEQLKFKKDHNCKSFKWFMENVAYEVFDKFPAPPLNKYWGEINMIDTNKCFDTHGQSVGGGPIGFSVCHHYGGNQLFRLNAEGQLALGERCIEASGDTLHIRFCDVQPAGKWEYNAEKKQVFNKRFRKCVEAGKDTKLHLKTCNSNDKMQQWAFKKVWTWK